MQITDLSILIPTYERPEYLARQVAFLSIPEFQSVPVFILDGSSPKQQAVNESIASRLRTAHYLRFDESTQIPERLYEGIKQATTTFSVILPDDDFLNPVGLQACIQFLQEHPDYSLAHGSYCLFEQTTTGELIFKPSYPKAISYEQDNPLHRMFLLMHNYSPVIYGVTRTHLLREHYRHLLAHTDTGDYKMQELLNACITLLAGKVKKLDHFYMAREKAATVSRYHRSTDKYILEPAFSNRYQRAKDCLKQLVDPAQFSVTEIENVIDYAFSGYIAASLIPSPLMKTTLLNWPIKEDVKQILNLQSPLKVSPSPKTNSKKSPLRKLPWLNAHFQNKDNAKQNALSKEADLTQYSAIQTFMADYRPSMEATELCSL